MNKLTKIFNVKTFVLLAIAVFVLVLVGVGIIEKKNKDEFEKRKEQINDNPMKAYENGQNAEFSDYLKFCKWNEENIDKIVLGLDVNGDGISKYYIDDKEVMMEILDELKKNSFSGGNDKLFEKRYDRIWTVQLISDEEEYSIFFDGYESEYEGVEIMKPKTCYPDCDSAGNYFFPNFYEVAGECTYLDGKDMYGNLLEIYNENIDEISIDNLKSLKDRKSVELTEYFIYTHEQLEAPEYIDEMGEYRTTNLFKFPIKNSKCYMEVQKYNESGSGASAEFTHLEIIRVEIFNEAGESIDLFECTDEEFNNFLN